MKFLVSFLLILAGGLPVNFIYAADYSNIVINEIAWMGTESSYSDEWIELYNNTDSPVNLNKWKLKAADNSLEINLTGEIPANGFYLLERTEDNTLPNIPANQIYSGSLKNTGEVLSLYDDSGKLIDFLNCSSGWLAGDNATKQTMERINSETWQNSNNPGGTPKKENIIIKIISSKEILPKEPETQQEDKEKPTTSIKGRPLEGFGSQLPYFIATATAFLSGGIIVILKKKLKN
ncbi:MAG: lamin tail domain-containing protein [Candidatus Nealsonbacteria bacterium]